MEEVDATLEQYIEFVLRGWPNTKDCYFDSTYRVPSKPDVAPIPVRLFITGPRKPNGKIPITLQRRA
jgi:hypothetical protein